MAIKPVVSEITDVFYLLFATVVGRAHLHDGILVGDYLTVDFIVHLLAPVVLAALGYTYLIYLILRASGCKRHHEDTYDNI